MANPATNIGAAVQPTAVRPQRPAAVFRSELPPLDVGALAVRLGAEESRALSPASATRVEGWLERVGGLAVPGVAHAVVDVVRRGAGEVDLTGGIRLRSGRLARVLGEARQVVCFVATLGRGLDERVAALQALGRMADAYVLDAIGSVAVEALVDRFERVVGDRYAALGRTTTMRFSPGYCDWPLVDQRSLFRLVDAGRVGVRLSDSCLMSPRKSVSGLIGIVAGDAPRINPCRDCRKAGCEARRS